MGSLTDLTAYSENTFTVTDEREPGPKFNLPTAFDLNFTITETEFTVHRQGLEIREIRRPTDAQLYYIIDTSAVAGTVVSLDSTPAGVTVSQINNMWYIGPLTTVAQWDEVKDATITAPSTFEGSFIYKVIWGWYDSQGIEQFFQYDVGLFIPIANFATQTTMITTTDQSRVRLAEVSMTAFDNISATLTLAGLSESVSTTHFFVSQSNLITGNPIVAYADDPGTVNWTVTVEHPNEQVTDMETFGSGGSVTYNASINRLTISGFLDQVNSHLNSIYFDADSTQTDFVFTYTATASVLATPDVRTQTANCRNADLVNLPTRTFHSGSGVTSLANIPNVYDIDYTSDGTYTYTLTFDNASDISSISTTGIDRWHNVGIIDTDLTTSTNNSIGISHDGVYFAILATKLNGFDVKIFKKASGSWSLVDTITGSYTRPTTLDESRVYFVDDYTLVVSDPSILNSTGRFFIYEESAESWSLAQSFNTAESRFQDWSDDGDVLVWTDSDSDVRIYTRSGKGDYSQHTEITTGSESDVEATVSGDGTTIAIKSKLSSDGILRFYRLESNVWTLKQTNLEADGDVVPDTNLKINYDGSRLYYWSSDGSKLQYMLEATANIWSTNTNYKITSIAQTGSKDYFHENTLYDVMMGFNQTDTKIAVAYTTGSPNYYDFVELHEFANGSWSVIYDSGALPGDSSPDGSMRMNKNADMILVDRGSSDLVYEHSFSADAANYSAGVLTQTGTKDEINADLLTLEFTPAVDEQDIELTISVTTPSTATETIDYAIEYRISPMDSAFTITATAD